MNLERIKNSSDMIKKSMMFIVLICIVSCGNEIKKETWYTKNNIETIGSEILNEIDSGAILKVFPFNNKDSIQLEILGISKVSNSGEYAELLKNYFIAKIFVQKKKRIPSGLKIKITYKNGINYYYKKQISKNIREKLSDKEFTDYIKFLLLSIEAKDASYFELTIPLIKKYYSEYDYDGVLLDLLVEFYFFSDNEMFKTWLLVFYDNCLFKLDEDMIFNKSIIDSVLVFNGFVLDELTTKSINNLYLDYYNIDTIKTVTGEVGFAR